MNNRILIDSYNKSAGIYDSRFESLQFTKFERMVERPSGLAGKTVLDLGCGTGLFSAYIEQSPEIRTSGAGFPSFHGIDFSPAMIEEATKRRYSRLVCGNINDLPWPDGFFDAAFSFTVLGLSDDRTEDILAECARVLKDDGTLAVTVLKNHYPELRKINLAQLGFDIVKSGMECGQDYGISLKRSR